MFESMGKPQYIVGFILGIVLTLLVAVFAVDIVVRGAYSLADTFRPVLERLGWGDDAVVAEQASPRAPTTPVRTVARAPVAPKKPSVPVVRTAPAAVAPSVPRVSNAHMSYSAFGTYWNGSFVAQEELNQDDVPAIRVMIYNAGNAPTASWTIQCSFGGNIAQTVGYQAPLGAGERAFAVCDSAPLPYGTHTVTVSYQEAGKAPQVISGTISVQ